MLDWWEKLGFAQRLGVLTLVGALSGSLVWIVDTVERVQWRPGTQAPPTFFQEWSPMLWIAGLIVAVALLAYRVRRAMVLELQPDEDHAQI